MIANKKNEAIFYLVEYINIFLRNWFVMHDHDQCVALLYILTAHYIYDFWVYGQNNKKPASIFRSSVVHNNYLVYAVVNNEHINLRELLFCTVAPWETK